VDLSTANDVTMEAKAYQKKNVSVAMIIEISNFELKQIKVSMLTQRFVSKIAKTAIRSTKTNRPVQVKRVEAQLIGARLEVVGNLIIV
jgi:hypothetical protein